MRYGLLFLFIIIILAGFSGCDDNSNTCNIEPSVNIENQQQHQSDIEAIDTFLAQNDIDAQADPSGLRFVINQQGSGTRAELCDNIAVTFSGRLLSNGEEFDSASSPVELALSNLISSWQIGIPKIQEGGSLTLFVPSSLGFGSQGTPGIPPNSNLIFDVQLVAIN